MNHTRRCPACGSTDVRRSRRRASVEALMLLFFFRPYRCRLCNWRFFGFLFPMKSGKKRAARLDDDLFGFDSR
jgi:hypothetical protein